MRGPVERGKKEERKGGRKEGWKEARKEVGWQRACCRWRFGAGDDRMAAEMMTDMSGKLIFSTPRL